jgi:hypothetical protein
MEIERREIKVWGSDYLVEKRDEDVDGVAHLSIRDARNTKGTRGIPE